MQKWSKAFMKWALRVFYTGGVTAIVGIIADNGIIQGIAVAILLTAVVLMVAAISTQPPIR